MKPIRCRTLATARIEPRTVRSMFRLFSRYYADVNFEEFRSDLQEKDECVLLSTEVCPNEHGSDEMESERIVGFTTLHRTRDHGPRGGTYLFTGDTVLDQCCWGRRILEKAFFWVMLKEKLRAPLRPLYWMLISKGYVTYLMMVRNFPSSYPRCDRSTPAPVQQRLDRYYGRRYPDRYSAQSGLVRSSSARGAVAGHLADPRGSMRRDPDVAYFLRHNPDYSDGDELACIAEVRVRDFARHFATAFRHRRNRRFRAREVNGPTSASGSPQAG